MPKPRTPTSVAASDLCSLTMAGPITTESAMTYAELKAELKARLEALFAAEATSHEAFDEAYEALKSFVKYNMGEAFWEDCTIRTLQEFSNM